MPGLVPALLSFVPVTALLLCLNALDTYRLLTLRRVVSAVLAGVAAALVCYPLNTLNFARWGGDYAFFGAPAVEEAVKAAYIFYCIARHRVAFPVDAAVTGFAVGAGFGLLENLVYLYQLPPLHSPMVWLVRGLGTALMHGGATAIVAMGAVTLAARWRWWGAALPSLALAIALHTLYNLGSMPPLDRTAQILLTLPALLAAVFWKSERMLAGWLHGKLDSDIEVLSMMESGAFPASPRGRYLEALRDSFPPEVVADLFCLIRMSVELSAQAKGALLRRELGFPDEPDPGRAAMLKEMAYLEENIGMVGRAAIAPLFTVSARDRWERQQVK